MESTPERPDGKHPGLPRSASRPILIGADKGPRSATKSKDKLMAQSCPQTFKPLVPMAPSMRPRGASIDPPLMELPPTPPVFSVTQLDIASEQASAVKKQVARSLATYSSSLPNNLDFMHTGFRSSFSAAPIEERDDEDDDDEDEDDIAASAEMLGKSPTIFSMLKSDAFTPSQSSNFTPNTIFGSLSGSNGSSFSSQQRSLLQGGGNSSSNNNTSKLATPAKKAHRKSIGSEDDDGDDLGNDELQFDITLDEDQ